MVLTWIEEMFRDIIDGDIGSKVDQLLERNAEANELIPAFMGIENRMKETMLLPDTSAHIHLW